MGRPAAHLPVGRPHPGLAAPKLATCSSPHPSRPPAGGTGSRIGGLAGAADDTGATVQTAQHLKVPSGERPAAHLGQGGGAPSGFDPRFVKSPRPPMTRGWGREHCLPSWGRVPSPRPLGQTLRTVASHVGSQFSFRSIRPPSSPERGIPSLLCPTPQQKALLAQLQVHKIQMSGPHA